MADFYVIATNIGEAKMANALALGIPLAITELALGDGEGDGARGTPIPNPEAIALVSERRRAPLNSFAVDPDNANVLIAEQVIPETVGGWWIREMGLFDDDGDMIFVCNTPPTYKPQLSEGSGRTQVVRMASIVSDTAAVTLKVDPSVVLATREYAQQLLTVHEEEFESRINERVIRVSTVTDLANIASPVAGWQASVSGVPFTYDGAGWVPAQGYVSALCFTGVDGGARIQAALDYSEGLAKSTVIVVPSNGPDAGGIWEISQTVALPSNVTLLFVGSYVKLANDVNVSMFRTKNAADLSAGENIHIWGQGRAVFDGNNLEQTALPSTSTSKERIGLHFFNITNFSVKNIVIRETHGWGISFENGCNDGDIGPIHFEQQGTTTNQDGVNLRQGCWDIVIHDITGTTGDDTIALTAIGYTPAAAGEDGMQVTYNNISGIDIHDITIRNVTSKVLGGHHTLRLLNADARKLYDINISDVNDITLPSDITSSAKAINAVITLNGGTYFDAAEVQEDEMRNIEIRNVSGNANSIILFGNQCGRINISGVTGRGYCKGLLRFDKSSTGSPKMKEISIRGLSFLPFVDAADFDWADSGTVIYVGRANLQNVDIEDIYILLCTRVFEASGDASIIQSKIRQSRLTRTGFEPFLIDTGASLNNCILQDFELAIRDSLGSGTGATPGRFYGSTFRFVLKGDCPDVTSADIVPNAYKSSRLIFEAGTGGFTDATYAMGDGVAWQPIVTLPSY